VPVITLPIVSRAIEELEWVLERGAKIILIRPAPVPGYAYLTQPPGWPIRLLLQRRDSAAPGDRTRAHVDFGCTDTGARDRHVALGARVTGAQEYWTVLSDPAGLAYCLVARDPK